MLAKDSILPVDIDDVYEARKYLKKLEYARQIDLKHSEELSKRVAGKVFIADASNNIAGSFKWRGAANFIARLIKEKGEEEAKKLTLVTASSGNHAQGLALAANANKINANIFMPDWAPDIKPKKARKFGGEYVNVIQFGGKWTEYERQARKFARNPENRALMVDPYAHPNIIAGQATTFIEILEELVGVNSKDLSKEDLISRIEEKIGRSGKDLCLLIPCGGGGLSAGAAVVLEAIAPKAKLIAVEPDYCPSLTKSLEAGKNIIIDDKIPEDPGDLPVSSGNTVDRVGKDNLKILIDNKAHLVVNKPLCNLISA